jgi:hypothetical protein
MDFLVSSLLLFIGDQNDYPYNGSTPDNPSAIAASDEKVSSYPPVSPEFSQIAIETMEDEWRKEYQAQIKEDIFFSQKNMLASAQERNKTLSQENAQLYETLSKQRSDLSQRSEELKTISRELDGLKRSYQAVQSDLLKAKENEQNTAREKASLLNEKNRLEEEISKATNNFAIKQKEYEELNATLQTMKERLFAQAQTIDSQMKTIQLQEETISTALKDIVQQQKDYAAEIAKRQNELMNLLQNMETKTASQENATPLYKDFKLFAEQQKNLQEAVQDLAETLKENGGKFGSMENKALLEAMTFLLEENKQIKNMLQGMAKNELLDTNTIAELQKSQLTLQSSLYDIAGKLDQFEARQTGPFQKLKQARVLFQTDIKLSRRNFDDATTHPQREFSNKCLLPAIKLDENPYAISHINEIGLSLNFALYENFNALWKMAPLENTNQLFTPSSPFKIPINARNIVLIPIPQKEAFSEIVPMTIMPDIKAIEKRGYRDVFVVKKTDSGSIFSVEVNPDLNKKGYVLLKRSTRQWLHFLNKHLVANPETVPEAGDFLVSAEGILLGILVEDDRALLITGEVLGGNSIPIETNSPEVFLKSIENLHTQSK